MRLLVIASLFAFLTSENVDARHHYHHWHHHSRSVADRSSDTTLHVYDNAYLYGGQRLTFVNVTGTTILDAFSGRKPVMIDVRNCAGDWSAYHLEDARRRYDGLDNYDSWLR